MSRGTGGRSAEDDRTLLAIARIVGFETLETRRSGDLDFREIAVWELKQALEAAHLAGRMSALQELRKK